MSIGAVTMRGGFAPWVQAVIEWTGTSATWTLTDTGSQTVLYSGPNQRYDMTTLPETIYHLSLADDTSHVQTFAYVSPPISAPVKLAATSITNTTATLTWVPLVAVDAYEVLVNDVSYNVLPVTPPLQPSLALTGLIPDRTYSSQIRAFMDQTSSLWSPIMYFTTNRTTSAEATQYEYEPYAAHVWNSASWNAVGGDLMHGSGAEWGLAATDHATCFFYSSTTRAAMAQLRGVRVLSAEVSITRNVKPSDQRTVLSHWMLHDMANVPAAPPSYIAPAMGVDSGMLALAQQGWLSIPTGWADAIINGTAKGVAWGGNHGRFQIADPITSSITPKNGTLRITIG